MAKKTIKEQRADINSDVRKLIGIYCDDLKALLLSKNTLYGNSALFPEPVFSTGTAVEGLCARIDDKLMRIKNGGLNDATEDTVSDLAGYLILLQIAKNVSPK
tara:strand:+ start:1022 stop:1330 length:309 start_codon:yes stop_codon:yes gene_type:complete